MHSIYHTIEAMELACEGEAQLIGFSQPELTQVLETVKQMPAEERAALHERLERINTIIEGQMMMYQEELDKLAKQITHVGRSNKATQNYRNVVAIIPVNTAANDE